MASRRKVTYRDCSQEQASWGSCADPRGILEPGKAYEVERMQVHSWHTKVFLTDFPGQGFNSCCFDDAQPSPSENQAFWDRKGGRPLATKDQEAK